MSSPGTILLQTIGLEQNSFGSLVTARNIDLEGFAAGVLHSIIGPNGAGKTTLLQHAVRHVCGQAAGRIMFDGKDVTRGIDAWPCPPRHRTLVSRSCRCFPNLTVFGKCPAWRSRRQQRGSARFARPMPMPADTANARDVGPSSTLSDLPTPPPNNAPIFPTAPSASWRSALRWADRRKTAPAGRALSPASAEADRVIVAGLDQEARSDPRRAADRT